MNATFFFIFKWRVGQLTINWIPGVGKGLGMKLTTDASVLPPRRHPRPDGPTPAPRLGLESGCP